MTRGRTRGICASRRDELVLTDFSAIFPDMHARPPHLATAFAAPNRRFRRTRFAPSPTGFLHLGHVGSAMAVLGLGRALGAEAILRIEDHDRGRSRPEFEAAIHADLAWLGLSFDDADESRARPSRYRQSDARAHYDGALRQLADAGLIYGCDCPRRRLAALPQPIAPDAGAELIYDGHCRERGLDWRTPNIGIRCRLGDGDVRFNDLWLGPMTQTPQAQCGDILLRDRHGQDTYQFAVVVDDLRHGIDLVIRGQDLAPSTGRQILLARALGRSEPPVYAHHPLLVDEDGKKLGKRFFSEAIARRRDAGDLPETLLGRAAAGLGLCTAIAPLAAADLPALFRKVLGLG